MTSIETRCCSTGLQFTATEADRGSVIGRVGGCNTKDEMCRGSGFSVDEERPRVGAPGCISHHS